MVQKRGRGTDAGLSALHRVRFLDWRPTGAVAACATQDGSAVAVARDSGRIELWDTASLTCISASRGQSGASLSSLVWAQAAGQGPRLISGALDGQLIEWDTARWTAAASTDSFGGAVWCLAAQPALQHKPDSEDEAEQLIAVGADDGTVRLFTTQAGGAGLQYARTMPRVDGRVLSAAWHPSRQILVTGTSAGTMHVWDIGPAQEVRRVVVGSKDTCVWALTVLPDGTMVSGDSTGGLAFWDAQFGTQLQRFEHRADVLAVAASPAGDTVFASGIDPRVCMYKLVPSAGSQQGSWQFLEAKTPHTHDVRALTVVQTEGSSAALLSAGNDARLYLSSIGRFQQEHSVLMDSCPEPPLITCSIGAGSVPSRVACMQHGLLNIWNMGSAMPPAQGTHEGAALQPASLPVHIASLPVSPEQQPHAHTLSLSGDGSLLAWADTSHCSPCLASVCDASARSASLGARFRAAPAHNAQHAASGAPDAQPVVGVAGWSVQRHGSLPGVQLSISHVAWAGDGRLLIAGHEGELLVVDVLSLQVTSLTTQGALPPAMAAGPAGAAHGLQPGPRALQCSSDSRWAALLGAQAAQLFDLKQFAHHGHISCCRGAQVATAAAFACGQPLLAIASTTPPEVRVFDVEHCVAAVKLQHASLVLSPQLQLHTPASITSICFAPDAKGCRALLASGAGLCHVDFNGPPARAQPGKRSRRELRQGRAWQAAGSNIRALPLASCCLLCNFITPHDVLLVEKSWSDVTSGFPPPLYRHRYGT